MKNGLKIVLILAAVVLLLSGFFFLTYVNIHNKLVTLDENVKTSWAQVENQFQRRLDLIPNLVETVKGYASHEKEVLTQVTQARASVAGAQTPSDKIQSNQQLGSALSRLLVVAERYPDLKANQNFLALQDELAGTENRIAVERRRYNETARAFNSTIRKIPYNLFAAGYDRAPLFEAEQGAQKTPKVSF